MKRSGSINVNGVDHLSNHVENADDVSGDRSKHISMAVRLRRARDSVFSRAMLEKRFPILVWAPKYDMDCLQGDLLAGFTIGLTVIPQSIAYALVAGVPANFGLYSAFLPCFLYMIFGGSKDLTIGPTAIMSILTDEYMSSMPCQDDTMAMGNMAVLLGFLTGCVILLATVFRIGFLITFIGRPVISGFTSASVIIIASSQVKDILGIEAHSNTFLESWSVIFDNIDETRWQDAVNGIVCFIVLLLMRSLRNLPSVAPKATDAFRTLAWKKAVFLVSIGRNAIIVVVSCCIAYGFRELNPFTITGHIEGGFPKVGPPEWTLTCHNGTEFYSFKELVGKFNAALFILPLIAVLDNIAIASSFSHGKAVDATQEMLALGLCNFVGGFFQSIPTTGSFSRTAVNASSGAKTPAGGIVTGVLVLLAMLFLTPVFKYIPKSTLAATIICSVIFMVEFHDVLAIWRTFKLDEVPLWVTFLLCLLWSLEWGILVGAAVHICILLYMQATPRVTVKVRETDHGGTEGVVIVTPALGLMFPNADMIKQKISKAGLKHTSLLIVVDCTHVVVVDYTSALAIQNLYKELSERQQRVTFTNMIPRVRKAFRTLVPTLEEIHLTSDRLPVGPPVAVLSTDVIGNGVDLTALEDQTRF